LGHAGQWVRLPARGFILVLYGNHSSEHIVFELREWDKQTDGQTTVAIYSWRWTKELLGHFLPARPLSVLVAFLLNHLADNNSAFQQERQPVHKHVS